MPNGERNTPVNDEDLKRLYREARTKATDKFNELAFGEKKATFLKTLTDKMRQQLIQAKKANVLQTELACKKFTDENFKEIDGKLLNQVYKDPQELYDAMMEFRKVFKDKGPNGPYCDQYLEAYCFEKLAVGGSSIYNRKQKEAA